MTDRTETAAILTDVRQALREIPLVNGGCPLGAPLESKQALRNVSY